MKLKTRVRILAPKPLPGGRAVQVVGLVDYVRPDGLLEVRVCTPGIYGGGIFKVSEADVEEVAQ